MKYKKAPIIEALIQIETKPSIEPNLIEAKFSELAESIKKDFPITENINSKTMGINLSDNQSSLSISDTKLGIKLSNRDLPYIAQIKSDGFTFSMINEYQNWETFSKKAKTIWNKYKKHLKPQKITKLAVRYVNRIDIPALSFQMEDYFETYPKVIKGSKSQLTAFFLQAQIPQEEGGLAVINQTATQPIKAGYTSIILDIDVFDPQIFKASSPKLWKRIDLLRTQKNELFENSITNKTRELFQ